MRRKRKEPLTLQEESVIAEEYRSGMYVAEIMKKHKIGSLVLRDICIKNNIILRSSKNCLQDFDRRTCDGYEKYMLMRPYYFKYLSGMTATHENIKAFYGKISRKAA